MNAVLWLLYWFCLAVGVTVVAFTFIGLVALIAGFYILNRVTVIEKRLIYISRVVGLRSVKWLTVNSDKAFKEFGMLIAMKERLVLQRSLNSVTEDLPVWEIFYSDETAGEETVISFFSAEIIFVKKREIGMQWSGEGMTLARFKETPYYSLVERAADMQKDIEKRFKPILSEAGA